MKIRHKIPLVFLTVVFISLSLLGLFSYRVAKHRLIEAKGEELTAMLLNQKININHILAGWIDRSRLVASQKQLRLSLYNHLQTQSEQHLSGMKSILADALMSVQLIERIVLCDPGGNQIVSVEKSDIKTPPCSNYVPHSKESYTLNDIWMQENGPEPVNPLLVSLAGPLEHEQKLIGVIYMVINATELIDIVNVHTALGSTGETLLARYDQHGDAQFVTPLRFDANTGLRRRVSAEAIRVPIIHALQKERTLFHFTDARDYKGVPVLAATDYIPVLDWGIVVKINRDEVLRPVYALRNTIMIYILVIVLLAFIIGLVLSHVITQPIATLAQVAQKIRDGDFSLRAQASARDETTYLATTFNQMLDTLQALEHQVKEKAVLADDRAIKVRELASCLTQAEQKERGRLAQILHDHLQQLLVAAKIRVNRLAQIKAGPVSESNIAEVAGLLEESISTSRDLTVELSPPVLKDAGFIPALEWLARWMKEKHGLEVSIHDETQMKNPPEEKKIILFQAVRELLFNVLKHAGTHQARVRMVYQDGRELCIEVEDQGKGFDPTILTDTNLTHFGLFHIRERLALLDCRMNVESAPGKGTRCTIYTPIEDPALDDSLSATEKPPLSAPVASRKIAVLVVDDHEILRQCLICSLRDYADIEVVGEAADGQEAVEKAMALEPDVIIMDIRMPGMSGAEATRKIKEARANIKIIGLSLHEADNTATLMLQMGASAYHCKTGPFDDLLRSIRDVYNDEQGDANRP